MIDDLGARGALFERYMVQAPYTWTSFGSTLTGKYPRRHGLLKQAPGRRMRQDKVTLPYHLKTNRWLLDAMIPGARSVADNMERAGSFDSDLGDDARVALYAKGRVLGKYLVTLAYDTAKQREDQRVLGTIDPQAYYTVFADGSSRRFDAAADDSERLHQRELWLSH